jgi:TolB-like protein
MKINEWKMEDVRHAFFIFSLLFLFGGCSSISSSSYTKTRNIEQNAVLTQSQNISLDSAIIEGSNYLIGRLSSGSKVAIVNIQSPTMNLTHYVIDTLSMYLVNKNNFIVIERSELGAVQKEQRYQLSGEVSDETAVSIGHQLGTQFIITGSMLPLGVRYSLRLKIINVETAQILGTKIYQINSDDTLSALLEVTREQQPDRTVQSNPQTVINNTTTINNNETTINGDVYINRPNGFSWE